MQQQRDLALSKELMSTKDKDLNKEQIIQSSKQAHGQSQQQSNCTKCIEFSEKITMLNTRLSNQEEMMAN